MYWSGLLQKRQTTCSLPKPKNEPWWSINAFWHSVPKHPLSCAIKVSHYRTIGHLSTEQWWWQHFYYVLKLSVNRGSTTFGFASSKMHGLCSNVYLLSCYWPPFHARTVATLLLLCSKNERQRNVNDFCPCIMENPWAVQQH
jgi:hypothetical protein